VCLHGQALTQVPPLQVVAQLLGAEPLPWEQMSSDERKQLGAFRKPVIALLNRDPSMRPSMPKFISDCNSIFATSATFGTSTA
jgi:hypothetical protein